MRTISSHVRALVLCWLVGALVLLSVGFGSGASADTPTTTVPPTTALPTTTVPPVTTPPTTAKPKTTTTTTKPTTTFAGTTSTATTAAPATTSSVPAVLVPPSSSSTTTPGSSSGGGGGLSAETKLRLVVGGLLVVGGGIAALTFLYWRRTRPPAINTALDALGDLDPLAASIVTAPPGPAGPPIAPTAVHGSPPLPASWLDLAAATPALADAPAATSTAAGAGTGVRILGPVAASVARAEGATPIDPEARPGKSDPSSPPRRTAPTIEPPPLTIVTLEDLQNRVEVEPAPEPDLSPQADPPGYGGDHD